MFVYGCAFTSMNVCNSIAQLIDHPTSFTKINSFQWLPACSDELANSVTDFGG